VFGIPCGTRGALVDFCRDEGGGFRRVSGRCTPSAGRTVRSEPFDVVERGGWEFEVSIGGEWIQWGDLCQHPFQQWWWKRERARWGPGCASQSRAVETVGDAAGRMPFDVPPSSFGGGESAERDECRWHRCGAGWVPSPFHPMRMWWVSLHPSIITIAAAAAATGYTARRQRYARLWNQSWNQSKRTSHRSGTRRTCGCRQR